MKNTTETSALSLLANDAGYDPLEDRLRENIRSTIEAVFEEELAQFLGRCRYGREDALRQGYRNGHRERQLTGTFGTERVSVPRARIVEEDGRASEWRSRALPRYQRLTRKAEALIASVYLSGTNTRRVKRALFGLFRGAVSKDVVSRAWRKVKVDWDAWCSRGLADEDIVRLILDGTVIKTRLDRKATNISVLAAIGVRRDGQKVLLSIGNMGGESQAAWRQFLDDLDARGLKRPGFVIVDGAPGLEAALSALWGDDLPVQRCTVHKHRNLLGHAPKHMHDELSEDYRDMVYADTASEVETRRKAFVRKWRLKCRAVADSLAEAGDKLFTFTRLSKSQWKSARTTNAIERLNEEFKRRIKTQTVLPCPETVPMLLWAASAPRARTAGSDGPPHPGPPRPAIPSATPRDPPPFAGAPGRAPASAGQAADGGGAMPPDSPRCNRGTARPGLRRCCGPSAPSPPRSPPSSVTPCSPVVAQRPPGGAPPLPTIRIRIARTTASRQPEPRSRARAG